MCLSIVHFFAFVSDGHGKAVGMAMRGSIVLLIFAKTPLTKISHSVFWWLANGDMIRKDMARIKKQRNVNIVMNRNNKTKE